MDCESFAADQSHPVQNTKFVTFILCAGQVYTYNNIRAIIYFRYVCSSADICERFIQFYIEHSNNINKQKYI